MRRFLSIFILALFLPSCEGDQTVKFYNKDFSLAIIDNSGASPKEVVTDSLPARIFGLRLNFTPVETYRKGRYFDPFEAPPSDENPISKIEIRPSADFALGYAADSLINTFFKYNPDNYNYLSEVPVNKGFYPTNKYRDDYEENNFADHADLLLFTLPTLPYTGSFTVKLTFVDKTTWSATTPVVTLYE